MPVDATIQRMLDQMNAMPALNLDDITPEQFRNQGAMLPAQPESVYSVVDREVPLPDRTLTVRVYTPRAVEGAGLPALVFYHGGGWVTGSLDSHDSICRVIANAAACVVLSVDYRLAPEHKFPAAVHDAYDSLVWIVQHADSFGIDPNRVAVGGDSAGGNLATVACILAKERHFPDIAYQWLLYPSTGYVDEPASMKENATGYFLTVEMMNWFRKHYLSSLEDLKNPYMSPILLPDLSGLPPAFIATAQYDPLRDVGRAYADRLKREGVPVTDVNFAGLVHGFANFHSLAPAADAALRECIQALRAAI